MERILEALVPINNDHGILPILQSLWPQGRLDLRYHFWHDLEGKQQQSFRIEAWPRNSGKGKALGRQYPYAYGGSARENAPTIEGAWEHVLADLPKCKWKRKPSAVITGKMQSTFKYLADRMELVIEAIRESAKKGDFITVRYRTPSITNADRDHWKQVRITIGPVKFEGSYSKTKNQVVGQGQTVGGAAMAVQHEMKRLKGNAEYAKRDEERMASHTAYQKRRDAINATLQGAEPGDLIIQAEGEKPTLVLAEKPTMDGHIKAWPLDPRQGTFLKFNYHSIQRTPRIAPMSPLTRKLLLAYVDVREKVSDHAIVVRGPDGRITLRAGTSEFGIYWRRDFRAFRGNFLTFLG